MIYLIIFSMIFSFSSAFFTAFLASSLRYLCVAEEADLCALKPYLVFCKSNPSPQVKDLLEGNKSIENTEKTSVENNGTFTELPSSVSRVGVHAPNKDGVYGGVGASKDSHSAQKHHPQPSAEVSNACDNTRTEKRFIRSVATALKDQKRSRRDYVDYGDVDPELYEYRAKKARLLKRLKAMDAEVSSGYNHPPGSYYNTKPSQFPYQHYQSSYYGDCNPYYESSYGSSSYYYPTYSSGYYIPYSNSYGYGGNNYGGSPYAFSGPGSIFNMGLGSGLNIGLPYGLGVGVNYGLGINVG